MAGRLADLRSGVDGAARTAVKRGPLVAWSLLTAHAALIAFSTAAMLTVLAGVSVSGEPAATIMRISFRFAGPTYVILGALTALAFATHAAGWRTAAKLAATSTGLALGAELAGTSAGLPFGDYAYSGMLGYKVLGLVPFPIPLSWFYMLLASLVMVARLRSAADDRATRWSWAFSAGLLMVAWDVSMDPAMVNTGHWLWGDGAMFRGLPGWLSAFFTRDAFYGMPLSNWFGWLLTATLIARVMLAIVPPTRVQSDLARSVLPVALYLANGVMPVALCLRDGFWWAAALGSAGMLVPATLAWHGGRRSPFSGYAPERTA
jgi:putative membrane protein